MFLILSFFYFSSILNISNLLNQTKVLFIVLYANFFYKVYFLSILF